ncbi:MAG: RagB/SusD family nutrient uptake outer membrane protein [Bacteroidales bacterium]|nr:RagB/SusD family nutrient uptake outer membrane protein [Bacteroidales bacterium]
MKKIFIALFAAAALAGVSCTNLDENVYSQIQKDDFLSDDDNLALYTSRPYTLLQKWGREQSMWTLILQLSNEVAVPKSWDGSWGEARYGELQTHEIPASNKLVRLGWEFCFDGISACNDAIYSLENSGTQTDGKKKSIAEIKILRAYYYLLAVDCFGNVPYSISKTETGYPEQKDRKFMLNWIETEINSNIGLLTEVPSEVTYGRVTKDVAKFLLAKIYLNSLEWTGTARWTEAAAICKEIIDSKHYKLTDDYKDNFKINNENSPEAILAIPYSSVYTKECFYPFAITLNSDLAKIWKIGDTWNGTFMGQPDFMATYDSKDVRKAASFLFGQVYDTSGKPWTYIEGLDASGQQIVKPYILEDVNIDEGKYKSGLGRLDGARIIKWPYQSDGTLTTYTVSMENDFILMRYADVVLMYVEALVRTDKASAAVEVADFKTIRTRAGLQPMTVADLTLDNLLIERQHELAMEGWSRQDLIRFGKYTQAWWAKPACDDHVKILPIPDLVRGANPRLQQNPGY